MIAIFRTQGYRRLWLNAVGNAVSQGGDFVLVGWLALAVTGSSAWVGTAFALYYLPKVVLGLPAGSLADRFDRRRLIQVLELGSAAVIGLFALLFHAGAPSVAETLVFTLCLGSLRALVNPVRLSFTYDLVGPLRITPALAGITLAVRLGTIAGALLIGGLTETFGVATALTVTTLAHLAACLCLAGKVEAGAHLRNDGASLLQNLKGTFSELRVNRVL